jgi:hypothetical protein
LNCSSSPSNGSRGSSPDSSCDRKRKASQSRGVDCGRKKKSNCSLSPSRELKEKGKKSLVDDPVAEKANRSADEIGIIFKSKNCVETKVCMRDIGSYVKFSSQECLHKGYKSGNVKTYLSAQLFLAPNGKRQDQARKEGAMYEKGSIKGKSLSQLKEISKSIKQGWEGKYVNRKYKAPQTFQFCTVNQKKTHKIVLNKLNFKDLEDVNKVIKLVNIF